MRRLVINGDEIYEVDEECLRKKCRKEESRVFQTAKDGKCIKDRKDNSKKI